jgi:hypothetical protein
MQISIWTSHGLMEIPIHAGYLDEIAGDKWGKRCELLKQGTPLEHEGYGVLRAARSELGCRLQRAFARFNVPEKAWRMKRGMLQLADHVG